MNKGMIKTAVLASMLTASAAMAAPDARNAGAEDQINGGIVSGLRTSHGQSICNAAINFDGSVAGGQDVHAPDTFQLGTGEYQVGFKFGCNDVRASKGFMRITQVDTLSGGAQGPFYCETADRAGVKNAVYVACFDNEGTLTDVSFFLLLFR